ncbi:hypothetical protein ACFXAQ_23620, partial [Streptomyces olivaceus]
GDLSGRHRGNPGGRQWGKLLAATGENYKAVDNPDRHYLTNRMVIDHASARAFLRRASESLRDAAKELDDHLGVQRFLAPLTRREGPPEPPPFRPGGLHR